jgi:hypothetical protein
MKKAARNTGTQHPIFWTKKISDMLGGLGSSSSQEESIYLLSPNLHFKKVSANQDRTFVENKTAMESQVVSFSAQNPSNMCEGWE